MVVLVLVLVLVLILMLMLVGCRRFDVVLVLASIFRIRLLRCVPISRRV